jgi:hypothetical protein
MMGRDELVALLDQVKNRLCHSVYYQTVVSLSFFFLSLCLAV